jgi:hypothetical protein
MIDGQSDSDGLFADSLIADLTEQAIGTEIETATTFGDRQDVGAESVTAVGLAKEAGLAPDDIRSEGPLRLVVGQVQTGGLEEGPEHGFIRQQLLAGIAGALPGVRLLPLFECDAKVVAGGK